MDCVFCNIASGKIPTTVLYQDDEFLAFPDAHPQAPTHILIIPKKHIQSLNHLEDAEMAMIGRMVKAVKKIAADKGVYESGYKLVINTGKEGGQVIQHLHLHLLGGKLFKG